MWSIAGWGGVWCGVVDGMAWQGLCVFLTSLSSIYFVQNVSVERYQGYVEREALFGGRSPRKPDTYRYRNRPCANTAVDVN